MIYKYKLYKIPFKIYNKLIINNKVSWINKKAKNFYKYRKWKKKIYK